MNVVTLFRIKDFAKLFKTAEQVPDVDVDPTDLVPA